MNKYYVVDHLHILDGYRGDKKMIGVYSSREAAEEAIRRVGDKPGFRDHPEIRNPATDTEDGFYIIECELDNDFWRAGFDVVPSDASEQQKRLATCVFIDRREQI